MIKGKIFRAPLNQLKQFRHKFVLIGYISDLGTERNSSISNESTTLSNLIKNERNTLRIISGCRKIPKKSARDASPCVSVKLLIDELPLSLSLSRRDFKCTRGGRVFLEAGVHTQLESARSFLRFDLARVTSSSRYKCFKGLTSRWDE